MKDRNLWEPSYKIVYRWRRASIKHYYASESAIEHFDISDYYTVFDVDKTNIKWYHKNCNCRHVQTFQEIRENSWAKKERNMVKDEYGITFKVRRLASGYRYLPTIYDDIPIKHTRSWKKVTKRKKQWK